MHGHLHRIFNHIVATSSAVGAAVGLRPKSEVPDAPTRLFGAPATCDGDGPSVRFYDVNDGALHAFEPPFQAA